MAWQLFGAANGFSQFQQDWDDVNRSLGNHVLLDSRFVVPLIAHFGSKDTVLAIDSESAANRLALLERSGIGTWNTFQPSQAPLGLVVSESKDEDYDRLFDLMRALPGFTAMLGILQQDPLYSFLPSKSSHSNIETVNYIDTPSLKLSPSFDEYWEGRGRNLRHNLARQTRRLEEQGSVLELVTERRPEAMKECVRIYGRLETQGWKAGGGTAIESENRQGHFYAEMLQAFASAGEATVFQLLLDGRVIACDLCIGRGDMLVVLKTTYDETLKKLSPALLMRREILRSLHHMGGIRVIEFYGRLSGWHRQWMSHVRTMFHVNLFRSVHMARTRHVLKAFR